MPIQADEHCLSSISLALDELRHMVRDHLGSDVSSLRDAVWDLGDRVAAIEARLTMPTTATDRADDDQECPTCRRIVEHHGG